jgi:hypothetical protein
VPSGEDRALIARLRLIDARIRHAPHIKVSVSGRLEGRAAGGMADTIKQRMHKPDELLDEAIEPVADAYRRAVARAALRAARADRHGIDRLARDLSISPASMRQAIDAQFFGAAWAAIQRRSPLLQRRRVPVTALAEETRHAIALLRQLQTAPQQSSIALIRNPRSMAENGLPMSSTPASSRPS